MTRPLTVARIQAAVAEHYGLSLNELTSHSRMRHIVRPRQVGMYFARSLTGLSYEEIGRRFGGFDHTTVMFAESAIKSALWHDADVHEAVETIDAKLSHERQAA